MKTKSWVLAFLLAATLAQSQTNNLTALLQQGLVEEQANRNLDAAIADYQSLASKFDKDRQIAATAVFRLGECYRAQGKTNEAAAQYQRILRDFTDQATLTSLSRQNLTGLGVNKTEPAAVESPDAQLWKKLKTLTPEEVEKILPTLVPDAVLDDLLQKRNEAQSRRAALTVDYSTNNMNITRVDALLGELNRQIGEKISGIMQGLKLHAELYPSVQIAGNAGQQQKELLAKQITLAEQDLADTQKLVQVGKALPTEVRAAEREVLKLRQQLAALDSNKADLLDLSVPISSEEDQEIQRIQQMIQNSPDLINAQDRSAITPLGKAATQGQLKVVNFLLDHGADINGGFPALYQAVGAGNRAMVELLLSRGADVNRDCEYGKTAVYRAVVEGYQSITELLLAHQADVNVADSRTGQTPLHLAISYGRTKFVQLLLAAGARVNTENYEGRTPLSLAAERSTPEIVKMLLEAKGDPNGGRLDAPLLIAIANNNAAVADMLLQAGANPNLKGAVNLDIVYNNVTHAANNHPAATPLFLANQLNYLPMVQLLLKFKANPDDAQTDGRAVLFSALKHPEILKALLEAGATVELRDETGSTAAGGGNDFQSRLSRIINPNNNPDLKQTPLISAAGGEGTVTTVEILLNHGANPNARDERSNTALHWAARQLVDENIMTRLLEHKANPNLRNLDGATPLDLVKEKLRMPVTGVPKPGMVNYGEISPAQQIQAGKLVALLRQHGALEHLPDWDRIILSRPAANASAAVFLKNTNDWNHYTLLELLLNAYPNPGENRYDQILLTFPDLKNITIVRPSSNGTELKRIPVNLLNATNGVDCAQDQPLEFGDVVELPEREHKLSENRAFLNDAQYLPILNYFRTKAGEVKLVVSGSQTVTLPLGPIMYSAIGTVLRYDKARAALSSNSDLTRVKVIRHDPATANKQEWILDCGGSTPTPDLCLRDGDVIEVPEKQ